MLFGKVRYELMPSQSPFTQRLFVDVAHWAASSFDLRSASL